MLLLGGEGELAHRYAIFLCSLDVEYSIGWRPSIWGGQIVSAIAEAVLDISLPIFLQNV